MRDSLASLAPAVAFFAGGCGPVGTLGGGGEALDSGSSNGSGIASGASGTGASDPGRLPPPAGNSSDASAPRGYTVEGANIYDSSHQPHLFHGVDRPSLEWNPAGEHLSESDYANMGAWKGNVVRIALNQDFWLPESPAYAPGYVALVDTQVQWAEAAGLDVILDLHWSDKGDYGQMPAQQRMADTHSSTFWTRVADHYKNDGRVLFELYNEPHDVSWDVWLHGGPSGDGFTVVGMQSLYDAVRATGAENLVVIGGLQFAYDLSEVPSHRVQGHNIVWATHPYNQTGKQPSDWDIGFGSLSNTDPVMVTEFGDTTSCGTDYDSELVAYADAHRISWSAWAWYVSGCQFPSLIVDWSGTPSAAGAIVKSALEAY